MRNISSLTTLFIVTTLVIAGVGLYLHPGDGFPWSTYFDRWLLKIVQFSLLQAFLSALFSIAIGLPFAWVLSQHAFKGQWVVKGLLNLFFIMPVLTVILSVVAAFSDWMNIFSLKGILIAHLYLNVPYVIRILWERLERISFAQRQLGLTLGFTSWHQFRWIDWPLLRQAIKPVFTIVFLLCFSSFTVVLTMGGGPANTNLEVAIYQALKFDFDPRAATLYAMIHGVIAFTAMWFLGRQASFSLEISREKYKTNSASFLQWVFIIILFTILFFPLVSLTTHSMRYVWQGSSRFWQAVTTSLQLAFFSAAFSLILALFRALGKQSGTFVRFLDFGLMVLPIMVITTGLFLFALKLNVAFTITGFLIIWLNGLMAMPLILSPLATRVSAYRMRYDALASSLQMSGWQQWCLIYWPALKPIIPWSFTLAVVLSVGDLGVAALIGSAQFVTLPILIYQAMGSYQMVLASQLTLVLLSICIILLLVAEWVSERGRRAKSR